MKTPANWKSLKRHALSSEYKDITGPAWYRFCLKIKNGFLAAFPIMLYEGEVLDGWQRLRACIETNTEPVLVEFSDAGGMTPEEYVEAVNDERRHETSEERQERIASVADRRKAGESLRTIAEAEGISVAQTQRDLEEAESTVPGGGTVEPPDGKVMGKDGRERPATMPKPQCPRCARAARVGQEVTKNCADCKELNKKPPPANDEDENADLPKSTRSALADTWHADCASKLAALRRECKSAFSWSVYLDAAILDRLKEAEELFLTAMPRKRCPDCNGQKKVEGENCQRCRASGYLASQVV